MYLNMIEFFFRKLFLEFMENYVNILNRNNFLYFVVYFIFRNKYFRKN